MILNRFEDRIDSAVTDEHAIRRGVVLKREALGMVQILAWGLGLSQCFRTAAGCFLLRHGNCHVHRKSL